ncbi:MAG: hypothetical protein ACNA7W_08530 [Pseudomonadales bacterium]
MGLIGTSKKPNRRDDPPANASQLRAEIDRGHTGDKVAAADPAVAPLGTDDECAGQQPTQTQVRAALDAERAAGRNTRADGNDATAANHSGRRKAWMAPTAWLLLIFVVAVLAFTFFALPA